MPDANGELIPSDVDGYTAGRMSAADPETQRILNSALSTLRSYCGWIVTPSATETIILDGTGLNTIVLPTLKVNSITSVSVYDQNANATTTIDVSDPTQLMQSPEAPGVLYRGGWAYWTWGIGNVTVTLNHGFDNVTAADWQQAVLELCDRMGSQKGEVVGNSGPMVSKKVDDVELQWARPPSSPGSDAGDAFRLFDGINHAIVDKYRLLPIA